MGTIARCGIMKTLCGVVDQGSHPAIPEPHSSDPESDLGLKFAPAAQTPGSESQGVVVIGIDPEGSAADLGIEAGDIIVEVSGKAVHTPDDISNALNEARSRGRQ